MTGSERGERVLDDRANFRSIEESYEKHKTVENESFFGFDPL